MLMNTPKTAKSLNKWGNIVLDRIKRQLRVDKTYATGKTYRELEVKIDKLSFGILSHIPKKSPITALELINIGRKLGSFVSIAELTEWARAKNVTPRDEVGRKQSSSQPYRRAAFAISRAIAKRGTIKRFGYRGSNLVELAIDPIEEKMTKEIEASMQEDIFNYIEKNRK